MNEPSSCRGESQEKQSGSYKSALTVHTRILPTITQDPVAGGRGVQKYKLFGSIPVGMHMDRLWKFNKRTKKRDLPRMRGSGSEAAGRSGTDSQQRSPNSGLRRRLVYGILNR
jgi:hypothetical protein